MPKIYDGTNGVETFNGKPSIRFVNSSTHYLDATEFASESTMTYFEAHKANGYRDVWSPDRNENATFADSQNYVTNGFYDGVTAVISGILKAPNLTSNLQDERLAYWLRDGSNSEVGVNGLTAITGTQASSANNRIRIGNRSAGANSFDGHFSELIAYASDESSNRTGIETNMNTFYDIY